MLKILQLKHEKLPEKTGRQLLSWISKSQNIREINISGLGLNSLAPLKGTKINSLDCSRNPIKDLSDFAGMPLRELFLNNCPVKDLTPLQHDVNLEKLTIPDGSKSITFLKKLQNLEYLDTKWGLKLQEASEFWKKYQKEP